MNAEIKRLKDKLARKEIDCLNEERKFEKEKNKCAEYCDQIKTAKLEEKTYQNKIELLNEDLRVERVNYQDLQNSYKRLNEKLEIVARYRPNINPINNRIL